MNVLIIFGTVEGQTRKIAEFAADIARQAGHAVTLMDTADTTAQLSLQGIDKVILAASVHERRHPAPFEITVTAQREDLAARDTLMLSISLNAAFPEGLEEARDYLTEMEMRTGFTPNQDALVAGAVRTASYDYFAAQVLRHVVLRDREYDYGKGDHEFTDWTALTQTLTTFLGTGTETADSRTVANSK